MTNITERRRAKRYRIALKANWHVASKSAVFSGATLDMSNIGVMLQSDIKEHGITVGDYVSVKIAWPSLLHYRVPLALELIGRVARVQGRYIAVKRRRYEFKIRPKDTITE